MAVAAAVAHTAQQEGVASSAALACLSRDGNGGGGGGGGDSLKRCIQSLQYDPEAAWRAAQA